MGIWVLIFEVHHVVSIVQVYIFLLIMLPNVIALDLFYFIFFPFCLFRLDL